MSAGDFLQVEDLVVEYDADHGSVVRAVDHVSFDMRRGEILGLVGESGCGKSTLGFSLLGLIKGGSIKHGSVTFVGNDLVQLTQRQMQSLRGNEIAMIFQASQNVLNPTQKVWDHFVDTLKAHDAWDQSSKDRIHEILGKLEIPPSRLNDYPFQFSGGMRQRVVIALSLILEPSLLIADEPTTALDVLVQARILQLLQQLKMEMDLTMILISHDLGVVAENSSRVAIMYAGQLVEVAAAKSIFQDPKHPYTQALIRAIPDVKDIDKTKQESIAGSPPDLKNPPTSCRFADRCPRVREICRQQPIDLIQLDTDTDRLVRCLIYDRDHGTKFKK